MPLLPVRLGGATQSAHARLRPAGRRRAGTFPRSITPDLPPSFGQGLKDAPINERCIGTCGEAVYHGQAVTCADIAHDKRWSQPWRDLCVSYGVRACHSTPRVRYGECAVRFAHALLRGSAHAQRMGIAPGRFQLEQVFINLLTKARDAMEHETRKAIALHSAIRGEWVKITVRDTGAGIPAELQPWIFEPFFTTKDVGRGTGLGLSISYRIIEEHGGRISVESRPGEGSTFIVELPIICEG
ncbi:MAG: ATP-binding protein [Nitrospiraceae bacterium]